MRPSGPAQPSYSAALWALLRLWPRLIVAYTLVVLLVYYAWPQIAALVAHGARSLILAADWLPHVGQLNWTESGYLVSDGILGKSFFLKTPSLRLMFGFPLGLALALPGYRTLPYWRGVVGTLIASVIACAALLAIMADWYMAVNLSQLGIEIHAGWHNGLLRQLGHRFWDLALLYPFLACLVLVRAALNTARKTTLETLLETVADDGVSDPPNVATPRRPWLQRGNIALLTAVLLVLAIELRAQHALDRPSRELADALLEQNPKLGKSYLRFAKTLETQGDNAMAARWYREAAKHKVSRKQAKRGLKRIRPDVRSGEAARQ